MQDQGYEMDMSLLYQDNMSVILLEINERASSSKHTKHIKVKYYLIKDKMGQGEITIKHCQTKQMWTHINTKPKQGLVFCVFRGHTKDVPVEYRDADYESKMPLSPKMLMPLFIQGTARIAGVCWRECEKAIANYHIDWGIRNS